MCKTKSEPDGFLSEPVKLNTDGVAIFLSSQDGIWPFFLFVDVNELPLLLRRVNMINKEARGHTVAKYRVLY